MKARDKKKLICEESNAMDVKRNAFTDHFDF
jgi:hypothetical protein